MLGGMTVGNLLISVSCGMDYRRSIMDIDNINVGL
jgi:hypothetical protein